MRPAELAREPRACVQWRCTRCRRCARRAPIPHLVILLPTARCARHGTSRMHRSFKKKNGQFLMSVGQYPHTPFAALDLGKDGLLKPFFPEYAGKRTQQLPAAWRANGALHILDVAAFERERSYYAQPLLGYPMPPERSVDVDNEADLLEAERLLRKS